MRVILADDHKVVRDGLRWMLSDEVDIEIVGEADSGEGLLALIDEIEADIVLLDVRMPGMSGLDALALMQDRSPDLKAIVLSMHDEPGYVRRAVELGASGYLLKSASRNEILAALRAVDGGRAYVQTDLTETLMDTISGRDRPTTTLSPRELEIIGLVAEGFENKQIATELGISETTVKTHLKSAFARLDVSSRAEAVAVALRIGIIQ